MPRKNNINSISIVVFLCPIFFWINNGLAQTKKKALDYVDNFIGVRDKNTSCVLGPQLPNASINPSPHTAPGNVNNDMDCYIMGQPIRGFAQLHVSGTGWGKYGQIFLSPQIGLATGETEHDSSKEDETAKPYEYAVTLSRYAVRTAVTPSVHSAIYKFTKGDCCFNNYALCMGQAIAWGNCSCIYSGYNKVFIGILCSAHHSRNTWQEFGFYRRVE